MVRDFSSDSMPEVKSSVTKVPCLQSLSPRTVPSHLFSAGFWAVLAGFGLVVNATDPKSALWAISKEKTLRLETKDRKLEGASHVRKAILPPKLSEKEKIDVAAQMRYMHILFFLSTYICACVCIHIYVCIFYKQISPEEIGAGLCQYQRPHSTSVQRTWAFAAMRMWATAHRVDIRGTVCFGMCSLNKTLEAAKKYHTDMTTGGLLVLHGPSSSSHCPRNPP